MNESGGPGWDLESEALVLWLWCVQDTQVKADTSSFLSSRNHKNQVQFHTPQEHFSQPERNLTVGLYSLYLTSPQRAVSCSPIWWFKPPSPTTDRERFWFDPIVTSNPRSPCPRADASPLCTPKTQHASKVTPPPDPAEPSPEY